MILYALRFYCKCDHETATASQILHIHIIATTLFDSKDPVRACFLIQY